MWNKKSGLWYTIARFYSTPKSETKPTAAKGTGKDQCHNAHQLDQDVERRTTGILEGVAYGVANHSCLVIVGTLAAHLASFDILLGIVPGTTGVCHHHCQQEARRGGTDQHAS